MSCHGHEATTCYSPKLGICLTFVLATVFLLQVFDQQPTSPPSNYDAHAQHFESKELMRGGNKHLFASIWPDRNTKIGDEFPSNLQTTSVCGKLNCNKRTKDIYMAGYPYSKFMRDNVLQTLERAGFNKRRYFSMMRENTNGQPYNDFNSNNPRTYELKTIGRGVRVFNPELVAPDPKIKRRFLCFGDSIVRETCNVLGLLVAGATVHANGIMAPLIAPHSTNTKLNVNTTIRIQEQLRLVYAENRTSVLFKWSPNFVDSKLIAERVADFVKQNEKQMNNTNTRTTIILGDGMHALFRHAGAEKLTIKSRVEHTRSVLTHFLTLLRELVPLHSIDMVWIGSSVNDADLLNALPRSQHYYYKFWNHFKMERLPVYERPLIESLKRTFPEISIHHVPRALHDRKYPGVRCDGMHFAKSITKYSCSGVAEVVLAFVNIILNVVESGGVIHKPDEFLPFSACPTELYDLLPEDLDGITNSSAKNTF